LLSADEKLAIQELEKLQLEIYQLQQKRWGILFYRDHQTNSVEAFAECDDEADKLKREANLLSESFKQKLQALQKTAPELVTKWAKLHIELCQQAQSKIEAYKLKEQLAHWQEIAAGKKTTPLNDLSQTSSLPNEEQELASWLEL
jgi:hypothetical protein